MPSNNLITCHMIIEKDQITNENALEEYIHLIIKDSFEIIHFQFILSFCFNQTITKKL